MTVKSGEGSFAGPTTDGSPSEPSTDEGPTDLFRLDNKTAVVIGGTGELCGTIAEGLVRQGAEVVLVGRSREKAEKRLAAIRASGGKGWFAPADVTRRESLSELLTTILERSGKVDILVNGAGINGQTPFFEIGDEEYNRIFNTNLRSVITACQVFGHYFIDRGAPASVINIGSMAAILPLSRVYTYSMTKAAVHNLSRNLARDWARHRIRVNTLVPGFFPAEQNRKILTRDRVENIIAHTPMSRFGNAEELIGVSVLLASDRAGSFITGAEFVVDGGFSAVGI